MCSIKYFIGIGPRISNHKLVVYQLFDSIDEVLTLSRLGLRTCEKVELAVNEDVPRDSENKVLLVLL